ncbi:D-cysteine desulfhydrase family protein [Alkaliphilus pronyensis]|uniref:D-cysteine desulfhydrase family protein n=1 Tax=Alkaliphilus pronyensis TaxID=1482732 RepID=A0A6I0F6Z3_9FIRM|nr:D-cysteine desulfhydrase family protein [Alkaliphilus pronyensis]KAB3533813.1 D-cysteine desulfhydrase family protein [Alkaliphilus pronyensis]
MKLPEHIVLANVPTKIEKLERLSNSLGNINIYVKRDDQTGTEVSGNKVRKLEFSVKEALLNGCDTLVTCGGIQSNHARATAAVAAKLGMKAVLVLKCDKNPRLEGNYFLDKVLGAKVELITPEEYTANINGVMKNIKNELDSCGNKCYIIPEGASNGIGAFGYFKAMEEIKRQEYEMGISFDGIAMSVGSGGTYGGLFLANKLYNYGKRIIGINVSNNAEYFQNKIVNILNEAVNYINKEISYSIDEIEIIDGYVGKGYGLSSRHELDFINKIAKMEGVVLDPVYTGKAMLGLTKEINRGKLNNMKNILFIHTGGIFSLFPSANSFQL